MPPRMQIMGPPRVWRDEIELDLGPRQQRCLLALLLACVGRPIAVSELVDLLWGPASPVSAVNVIHKYIGALRRLLEPDLPLRSTGSYLLRHGSGYCLAAGPESLDLVAFRRLVATAKQEQTRDRLGEALDRYLQALQLCQGSAGDFLIGGAGGTAIFAGIDDEFFDAAVAAAEIALRTGRASQVLAPLRLATMMAPFNEPVYTSLVTALAATGYQAEALAAYRTIRNRLVDELGIEPGRGLQDAHRRALTRPAPRHRDTAPAKCGRASVQIVRPAQLPPDLPCFVGRTHELNVLGDLVTAMRQACGTSPLVIAMAGMGGVGKSTLATRFAHTVADRFSDGQLYLDLRGHVAEQESVRAGDSLRSLLYALGVAATDVPDTFDACAGTYRSLTAGKRILLLLDNAPDASQVRPLLPNSAGSLVLVTSRSPLIGLAAFDDAHLLQVDLPDLRTSRELIERRLDWTPNRPPSADDGEEIDEIIELCGRLPLALALLAARIAARPSLSPAMVAAELRHGTRRLETFPTGRDVRDPRTAFSGSYQRLSPDAARLFRLLAAALSSGVSVRACASLSGHDLRRTREELAELTEAALVAEDDNGRFTSHVLVRAYAEELLNSTDPAHDRRAAIGRLLHYYLHSSVNAQVVLQPELAPIAPVPPPPDVLPERPATRQAAIEWFSGQCDVLHDALRLAAAGDYGVVHRQLALTLRLAAPACRGRDDNDQI